MPRAAMDMPADGHTTVPLPTDGSMNDRSQGGGGGHGATGHTPRTIPGPAEITAPLPEFRPAPSEPSPVAPVVHMNPTQRLHVLRTQFKLAIEEIEAAKVRKALHVRRLSQTEKHGELGSAVERLELLPRAARSEDLWLIGATDDFDNSACYYPFDGGYWEVRHERKLTCLLYTSPSPRDS
eukprot:TRINITY_DN1162_c0_g2_i1.p1 TRINITY_DN1162_c0_g2~~TRINITY_DN1162_c0_g2_i1.p1  ORF type:complete len:181 (+),score=29.28 TRINITY_DN1162_c0_g2_i1:426-968(+)